MKATIHQGIINVPVKLTPTIKESYYGTGLNQFCIKCNGRVRYKKVCENEGTELTSDDITKGYMLDKEKAVVFTKEELANLESENNYMIELFGFKKLSDKELIGNLIFARKSYYVDTANKKVAGIFQMFKSAIEQEEAVGVVKLTNRSCEHLGYLLVANGVLYFVEMPFGESVKEFKAVTYKTSEKDIGIARQYIGQNSSEIDIGSIVNTQKERTEKLIEQKIKGEPINIEVSVGNVEGNPFEIALQKNN
jgi:DNA end-binding protein Ku